MGNSLVTWDVSYNNMADGNEFVSISIYMVDKRELTI